jgi:hypothetical protein
MAKRKRKDVPAPIEPDEMDDFGPDDPDEPEVADETPDRPTLAEMAAQTAVRVAEAAGGVRCPRCGCGHSRVAETWDVAGGRRRKRVCRHCGRAWGTTEA